MPPEFSRRALLAATASLGALGVGYGGARTVAKTGTITVRLISGETEDDGTTVDSTEVFYEALNDDGTRDRRLHDDYQQWVTEGEPATAPPSLHRDLTDRFDEVRYHVGHACPDARCSTPRVSRHDFNELLLGESARLLYHSGDSATLVPG